MKRHFSIVAAAVVLCLGFSPAARATSTLTLTTYNIHGGVPDSHSSANYQPCGQDLQNIIDVLTTCGADIIGLQEVRNNWDRPVKGTALCPMDQTLFLASRLQMSFAFAGALDLPRYTENRQYLQWGTPDHWVTNGAPQGEFGVSILSRYRLAGDPKILKLPRGTDEEALKKGDEPRVALRVELQDPIGSLGKVIIYNTHFQHNNGKTREAQMTELLTAAKADAPAATVFLMGDFNHHPREGEPDLLGMAKAAGFHDLAAEYAAKTGIAPEPTVNFDNRPGRIDYVFCSKPVNTTKVTVLKTPVSDHLPLSVTIQP